MATLHPYLHFNGTCEAAFRFYRDVFGGEFSSIMRYADLPVEQPMSEAVASLIMFIKLPIGPHSVLMGSDTDPSRGQLRQGDEYHISIDASSEAEASHLYHRLSAGGQVEMPLEKTFGDGLFAMFRDKYGIQWVVNYAHSQDNETKP